MYRKVSTDMNFVEREKEVLQFWQENDIFRMWEAAEKEADLRDNQRSYINTIRSAFEIEEIKVDKKPGSRFKRIDPVDAFIDSHYVLMLNNGSVPIDLSEALKDYLADMGWGQED